MRSFSFLFYLLEHNFVNNKHLVLIQFSISLAHLANLSSWFHLGGYCTKRTWNLRAGIGNSANLGGRSELGLFRFGLNSGVKSQLKYFLFLVPLLKHRIDLLFLSVAPEEFLSRSYCFFNFFFDAFEFLVAIAFSLVLWICQFLGNLVLSKERRHFLEYWTGLWNFV